MSRYDALSGQWQGMKRRSRVGGKAGKAGRRKAATPKRAIAPKAARDATSKTARLIDSSVADLQKRLERQARELEEARQQQAASSEVLHIISASAGALMPVFKAIVKSAVELCGARFGAVFRMEGDLLHLVTDYNFGPAQRQLLGAMYPMAPNRGHISGRTILTGAPVQIPDIYVDEDYKSAEAKKAGFRSLLAAPLLQRGRAIGSIVIYRTEPGAFTERQLALLQTFADQAVIAIENVRLFEAEQQRTRELGESLEQQTATSEVLRVISSSPGEIEPVFAAMLENAVRICDAKFGVVYRCEGDVMRSVAMHNVPPGLAALGRDSPFRPGPKHYFGPLMATKTVVHVADIAAEQGYIERRLEYVASVEAGGVRTFVAVPMLKGNELIGVFLMGRQDVRPFTDKQIALVQSFAAQAVIAIENTRLLSELRQSLQQQTSTADVLKIISRATFDLQIVLDTLVESAVELCDANYAFIFRRESDKYQLAASHGFAAEYRQWMENQAIAVGRETLVGRTAFEGRVIHIPDVLADPEYVWAESVRRGGFRTMLGLPLLREGVPIGVIAACRSTVRPFTDKQIELMSTFADQAVIAIENVRLFEEVQARTRELQEALDYQTATSNVLEVISRTPIDLRPVLAAICDTVAKLCETKDAEIFIRDGDRLRLGWVQGSMGTEAESWPITRALVMGRAVLSRELIQVHDLAGEEYPEGYQSSLLVGHRTIIAVPLMRKGEAVGVLTLRRSEVKPFTDKQITLLRTFADQAVIAIENTRLFEEVQARTQELARSVEELKALGEVGQAVNSTLDVETVLRTIVTKAVELSVTDAGAIYVFDDDRQEFRLRATYGMSEAMIAAISSRHIGTGDANVGEAARRREPIQVADLREAPAAALNDIILGAGYRALLVVPLLGPDRVVGALVVRRKRPGEFTPAVVSLMQTFADQSVIALENARLFEEIAQKSRELEIASQHKSQFVANMSHELRTPLAAMLGYAELMAEGIYEPLGEKSLAALARIRSNGKHLLGLINTVLDIAKIESGQFTLNMQEYSIETVVETVRVATESLAQNKKLALTTAVTKPLPIGIGDEQRLTQVLLNLVGNAIKFTDTGEVRVTAEAVDGHFAISVVDTGPGIPEQERTRIFEQFHQVDDSNTKAKGGTGLGLAIAKQIVEMHGGRIWVDSTVGKGSTFQMELPVRAEKMIA